MVYHIFVSVTITCSSVSFSPVKGRGGGHTGFGANPIGMGPIMSCTKSHRPVADFKQICQDITWSDGELNRF